MGIGEDGRKLYKSRRGWEEGIVRVGGWEDGVGG
jgi:hypothetical protein